MSEVFGYIAFYVLELGYSVVIFPNFGNPDINHSLSTSHNTAHTVRGRQPHLKYSKHLPF